MTSSGRHRRRVRWRVVVMYALAIAREFRWTLLILAALLAWGAVLYAVTPLMELGGQRPNVATAMYGSWMAMLAEPMAALPLPWHIEMMQAIYPIFGFLLIGEGIVRLALLLMSKRHGEKEWMRVMANTYRDHIILCGLGHLGYRVFELLLEGKSDVVVIEIDANNRFLSQARTTGACILVRDMKDDQAIIEAGIDRARAILIATNDDMANLEVAMDARRLNPKVRILLRLFDQKLAQKISGAMTIDAAFSASALAAPIVAGMSMKTNVLGSSIIGGVTHVTSEIRVEASSPLAGKRIDQIEMGYAARVLARMPKTGNMQSPPSPATAVEAGDVLVMHSTANQLMTLAAAGGAA